MVIKTDNQALADLVLQADEVHNTKFQSAAKEMGSLSSKTGPIAKEIAKQAKQSAK